MTINYKKYLKTDCWEKKKNTTKHWHGNKCRICRNKKIDIHHKTYKNLSQENVQFDLIPMCRFHHFQIHKYSKENNVSIYEATEKYIKLNSRKPKKKRKKQWKDLTNFEKLKILS